MQQLTLTHSHTHNSPHPLKSFFINMKSVAARALACASVKRVSAARSFVTTPVLCVQVDESPVSLSSFIPCPALSNPE